MIPTIAAIALGALGTLPAPSPDIAREEVQAIGIELFCEVSESHFAAKNDSHHDYVLVFGDLEHGVLTHSVLHGGQSMAFAFPVGTLDGVFVEFLALHEAGWTGSGAMPLGELAALGTKSFWVQAAPQRLNAWIEDARGFELWSPCGPLLPGRPTHGQQDATPKNATHVPVVDPSDEPEEEAPPVLEPKPLPPV